MSVLLENLKKNPRVETYNVMPVKLTKRTLSQVLLRGGNVSAAGQVGDDLLAQPPAVEDARMGVREAPLQVGDNSSIGRLLAEIVRVGLVEVRVSPSCVRKSTILMREFRSVLDESICT